MGGYLVNFAVYTMAMTGLIFFALMVYKKFTLGSVGKKSKSSLLCVEETISLAPRKTLYVVRAGKEKFLIAGDVDKTTLISKLNSDAGDETYSSDTVQRRVPNKKTIARVNKEIVSVKPEKSIKASHSSESSSVDDLPVIVDFNKKTRTQENVLHNMLRKINE